MQIKAEVKGGDIAIRLMDDFKDQNLLHNLVSKDFDQFIMILRSS